MTLQPETMYDVTIVIPTYDEPGIGTLLENLDAVCSAHQITAEFLIVDDTPHDATIKAAEAAATVNEVATLHRPTSGGAWGGLAGAVLDGIEEADGPLVIVMDGDGQHPPTVIPIMVQMLTNTIDSIDMVVASRYTVGGDAGGLDGGWRHTVSSASTTIARLAFPKRVGAKTTDPMTGFFGVRVAAIDTDRVAHHAVGFKILLAILATHPVLRVAEVPFVFGERQDGESKASMRNGIAFLRQITRMRVSV